MSAALVGAAIGAGAQMAGGIASLVATARHNRRAREALANLEIPEIDEALYRAEVLGDESQLQAILQQNTELQNIVLDAVPQQAQQMALQGLMERGREGFTVEELANLRRAQSEMLGAARGQRLAQESAFRRQGLAGSGLSQQAAISGAQNIANRLSQQGLDIAAMGNRRALEAMTRAGQLGGQMQAAEWGRKSQTASAQDAIRAANAAARMGTQQFNIGQRRADVEAKNRMQQQYLQDVMTQKGWELQKGFEEAKYA